LAISPSNAHAYRLYVVNDPQLLSSAFQPPFSPHLAAISEAL
jgi:hypothetical protein